ncbi:NAD-dependent epimerase/dehydratase family protein [Marivirga salinae]|uniref:NAD-dependent epimerase/dehydratase family protein n=1 Tax=Marivirga salinarum TaxID=3059078 RepID=A0AA51NEK9_9BACT|nr:NAD-dependent epimerase/dehydratase family protein [Marivirga sp. BDSF4-3]WMN12911.1 NAD-dependent epimerase/dehydratase family protein [Marivirga sp. BDSF4-3]
MASVSILGCGWLGFPLAKKLIAQGYEVKGSTTTASKMEELKEAKINAFNIDLPNDDLGSEFFNSDYLIINIPPKTSKKGVDHHIESLKPIIKYIPPTQKIIYISATSVYPKVDHPIDEEHELDHQSERAQALIQAEQLLLNEFKERLTIIRFGGLLGYERIPGRYFSGKPLAQHEQKVNYIHRDDAVGIIQAVIKQEKWSTIINGTAPKHPTKKEVFLKNAKDYGFEAPQFENIKQELTNRIIESSKIEYILDYSFTYPDPLDFFYIN